MNIRARGASELRKFVHLLILKLLFPSIFCWYILQTLSLCLRNIYIFRSPITSAYIYNQCSFLSLLMVWHYDINDKILTLRKSMYMRASGASELRKFLHFHIQKLLFISIFCWYFRNFVGTNDIFVGLHVPTDFQIYRQNSEKALWVGGGGGGGWGAIAPLPPLWLH